MDNLGLPKDLRGLCKLPPTVRTVKSRRTCLACSWDKDTRNSCRIVAGKPLENSPIRRP
jgi:hypothetical protein